MKYTASLHTHTARCHHAGGTEREYIEKAIAEGLSVIGFADHAPYEFPDGYVSNFRMRASEMEDYFTTLLELRDEYRGKIDVKIGFEAEYYPALFEDFMKSLEPYPIDYLILGQHYLDNETSRRYSGKTTDDASYLADYVDQVSEGIRTGVYSYVAHPDLVNFIGDSEVYDREYARLIECACEVGVPLEINLLGLRAGRHYPNERFISLCGKMGAPMCIGADAHRPEDAADTASAQRAFALMEKYGVRYVESVPLRPVKI